MWSSLSISSGCISVSGYIPRDAPIVDACEKGDEATVRRILRARQTGPNDYFTASDLNDPWLANNDLFCGDYNLLIVSDTSWLWRNNGAKVRLSASNKFRQPSSCPISYQYRRER